MKLNRKLQHNILTALEEKYPDSILVQALPDFTPGRPYMANLFYLQEHGLIQGGDIREPGQCRSMVDAQITAEGMDFLKNDGGIPAIRGEGTIALEIRQVLKLLIDRAAADAENEVSIQKRADQLRHMGPTSLRELVYHLLETGDDSVLRNVETDGFINSTTRDR